MLRARGALPRSSGCCEVRPRFASSVSSPTTDNPSACHAKSSPHRGFSQCAAGAPARGRRGRAVAARDRALRRHRRDRHGRSALAALFAGADVVEHDGGHMLPSDAGVRRRASRRSWAASTTPRRRRRRRCSARATPSGTTSRRGERWALSFDANRAARGRAQLGSFGARTRSAAARDEGDHLAAATQAARASGGLTSCELAARVRSRKRVP